MTEGEHAPQCAQGLHRVHHQTYDLMGTHSGLLHANGPGQTIDDWSLQAEVTAALPFVSEHGDMGIPGLLS